MHGRSGKMQKRTALTDLLSLHRFYLPFANKVYGYEDLLDGFGDFYILFSI